jgi:hypothetical protein
MGASFYVPLQLMYIQLCKLIEHGIFLILSDVGLQCPCVYGPTKVFKIVTR